jgi:hypothetical protein
MFTIFISDKGLKSGIYKELKQLNGKNPKQFHFEMSRSPRDIFQKEDMQVTKKYMKKML